MNQLEGIGSLGSSRHFYANFNFGRLTLFQLKPAETGTSTCSIFGLPRPPGTDPPEPRVCSLLCLARRSLQPKKRAGLTRISRREPLERNQGASVALRTPWVAEVAPALLGGGKNTSRGARAAAARASQRSVAVATRADPLPTDNEGR
eukprot:2902504-Pyramimonas_sp.AAC.1